MSNHTNTVAIVSYVKHFDANTKGTMELPAQDLDDAREQVITQLINDAREEGILLTRTADLGDFFTITKAEFGQSTNWVGI